MKDEHEQLQGRLRRLVAVVKETRTLAPVTPLSPRGRPLAVPPSQASAQGQNDSLQPRTIPPNRFTVAYSSAISKYTVYRSYVKDATRTALRCPKDPPDALSAGRYAKNRSPFT